MTTPFFTRDPIRMPWLSRQISNRLNARVVLISVGLALGAASGGTSMVHAQAAPYCAAGQAPAFVLGIAKLQQRLGSTMGNPLECEHTDPVSGDVQQNTSTGLAYFRGSTGTLAFTDGWRHFALIGDQLMLWRNPSLDPPQPTAADRTYVDDTLALRSRVDQLDQNLTDILHSAQSGDLASIDFGTLGNDVDELQMLRDEFLAISAPPALSSYADKWLQAQQADIDAGQALLQARLDDNQADANADLTIASTNLLQRDQLRSGAQYAYSEVLPVAAQ